jgi:hypothetical protein
VERALLAGPQAGGFDTELWTLPRVAEVIWRLTRVSYHPGHVWWLLRRHQWSPQRPARRDELKGEIAKAYVVLEPGAEADADGILALCRAQLAAYKVPRSVQFVADLPKTSTGKIMRRELWALDVESAVVA